MTVDSDFIAAMNKLLVSHGASVTFRRTAQGAYDPATGTSTPGANDDETVKAHFQNYNRMEQESSNIERDDLKCFMSVNDTAGAALSKTPQIDDKIIDNSVSYTVVNVRTYRLRGNPVLYCCQVRT